MAKRPKRPPVVVRPSRSEHRELPEDLAAIARGDRFVPRRRPRLRDDRPTRLVPGVKNQDARLVFDTRLATLRATLAAADEPALRRQLAEVVLLAAWRGRSITNFDALAEQLLELPAPRARALAIEGCGEMGIAAEPLNDESVAVWMRTEAAMIEGGIAGRVTVVADAEGTRQLRVQVPLDQALSAFALIARSHAPLVRDGLGRP
jgi:hypothetical protein